MKYIGFPRPSYPLATIIKPVNQAFVKTINETKLDTLSIVILIISTIIILFSFFAPLIFVQPSINDIDFSGTGEIGDTISGLMNPFIAISGVLLTFLAFYIQFKANRLQRNQFRIEMKEQNLQFMKTQFENQFYEMLKLHKDNVNDIEITLVRYVGGAKRIEDKIRGRSAFNYLIQELELCLNVANLDIPKDDIRIRFNEAYGVFFHGISERKKYQEKFFKDLRAIKVCHENSNCQDLNFCTRSVCNFEFPYELNYSILDGYSSQLAHYYRHIFQTVKFVATVDETLISYEKKRNYLRILRAQMSNQEQLLLFYNWYSGLGVQWENESNKFFTDYRMIHNIDPGFLYDGILIQNIFDLNGNFRKETNRHVDSLFEFEDWR